MKRRSKATDRMMELIEQEAAQHIRRGMADLRAAARLADRSEVRAPSPRLHFLERMIEQLEPVYEELNGFKVISSNATLKGVIGKPL